MQARDQEPNKMRNNFIEGIFDSDLSGDYKLWKGPSSSDVPLKELMKSQILFSGYVGRKSSTGKIKNKFFVLTSNYLYYKNNYNSTVVRGVLNHKWARMEVHEEEIFNRDNNVIENKFTIKILKNYKFSSIFFDEYIHFYNWKQALINVNVIQTDFHDKFKTIQKLGKGSFASVSISPFLTLFNFVARSTRW